MGVDALFFCHSVLGDYDNLSPISTLPNEVLLDILSMVPTQAKISSGIFSPVVLSHVSKLWRTLTLGLPNVWANILVDETMDLYVTHFVKTLSRVKTFLDRSGQFALDINIILRTTKPTQSVQFSSFTGNPPPFHDCVINFRQCSRILSNILAPHVRRFRSFLLSCDEFKSVVDIQHEFLHTSMPLLKSWRVSQNYVEQCFDGDLHDERQMTALSGSILLRPHTMATHEASTLFPQLETVAICAIPMTWSRFCPSNLRFLEISYLPVQARPDGEALRQILLAVSHSLEALKLYGAAPTSRAHKPYEMPKLQTLELGYAFPDELIPFVEDIRLPSLIYFSIEDLFRSMTPIHERRGLVYDHTTALLFYAMVQHLPLQQLRELNLRHVCFMSSLDPDTITRTTIGLVPNLSGFPIPTTPFEFFCKLTALKNLYLVDPDPTILFILHYQPLPASDQDGADEDGTQAVPIPTLRSIRLMETDEQLLHFFLHARTRGPRSFTNFSTP